MRKIPRPKHLPSPHPANQVNCGSPMNSGFEVKGQPQKQPQKIHCFSVDDKLCSLLPFKWKYKCESTVVHTLKH